MSHIRSPSVSLLSSPTPAAPVATTSTASSSTRGPMSVPRSPILNIQAPSHKQPPSQPVRHSALSKAKMKQSTTLSLPPANEKGTDRPRSEAASQRVPADLMSLSDVSEKRPTTRPAPAPNSASGSRCGNAPRSPARAYYPPQPREPSDDQGCCGWFINLSPRVRLWLSFGAWGATSIGFILAIAFWKKEVFTGLDNLSHWLVAEGWNGYAIIFFLIFLTTIPPLPLYSTFMMLSGYTFGTWEGFLLSYSASLVGAVVIFALSRRFLGKSLVKVLSHSPALARTVRAVSKNPKLLFLVRLAPYPYNVMNVLLAACPSLTMRRYAGCTGLSLLKVVIHTSIGAGIHSFTGYYGVGEAEHEEGGHSDLARWSTIIGVVLCVLLLGYLSYVARRAVDDELEGEDCCESGTSVLPIHHPRGREIVRNSRHSRVPSTAQERMAFLSPVGDPASDSDGEDVEMGENSRSGLLVRSSSFTR